MRIPPYYRSTGFQRLFFGVVMGALISWLVFLFIFGKMQEDQVKTIRLQEEKIADLTKEKDIWQEDFKKLNEKNKELLTVQDLFVKITNGSRYKIDALRIFEFEEEIKDDITHIVLAKDLNVVFSNGELLKKIIENKPVVIKDRRYKLNVKQMVFYTTVKIEVELTLE